MSKKSSTKGMSNSGATTYSAGSTGGLKSHLPPMKSTLKGGHKLQHSDYSSLVNSSGKEKY